MQETFKLISRHHSGKGCDLTFLNAQQAAACRDFHKSFPR